MRAILIDGPVAGKEVVITGYQEYVVEVLRDIPPVPCDEADRNKPLDIGRYIRRYWYRPVIVDSKRDIGIMSACNMTRHDLTYTVEELLGEASVSNNATAGVMASLQADNIVPELVMLFRQMAQVNKRINDLILES